MDTSPVFQQKVDAALCHRTQHALFMRRSSEQAGRKLTVPEVIMPLESLHRVLPDVGGGPLDDPLAALLAIFAD